MVSAVRQEGAARKRPRPWQVARPAQAAARQSPTEELVTVVAFDVPSNKARRKVGEICLDYGLVREQWSVFEGPMTRNRREELCGRLEALLDKAPGGGRFAVMPIGRREAAWARRHVTHGTAPLEEREKEQEGGEANDRPGDQ
jgi:CRISPR-associated protein Cas2